MANDPNRDVLPVKEENNDRITKDCNERIDHQLLIKLSRSELEDRFLRLLDEQTHLKKLVNCQEEKIKRLGTKLLRIIGEKKSGKKSLDHCKETEELNLRIIELEHENYTLKDKNTVLKQQLANHSRHITAHRSPLRSSYTSPIMSVRQAAPIQNEVVYESSNKNAETESQLRDAEMHIKELNEEIKALHDKIEYLQQDMERNCLDGRKTKVTENIELIRLQRSLKQQAVQIAALQAQVKNSENNQKLLKQELIRAQDENEEAMNLISVKQNEILTLCSKLEEKNLSRLEEAELRERINDLVKERNELKERSDFLMKTIDDKSEESEQVDKFKKLLCEEKLKKEQLEVALKKSQNLLKYVEDSNKGSIEAVSCCCDNVIQVLDTSKRIVRTEQKKEIAVKNCLLVANGQSLDKSETVEERSKESENSLGRSNESSNRVHDLTSYAKNNRKFSICKPYHEKIENGDIYVEIPEEKCCPEEMELVREIQYLKQMLKSQTARCEAQQSEISRLMYELKLNEEKYSNTLQRLDSYLQNYENVDYNSKKITSNYIPKNLNQEEYSVQTLQDDLSTVEESSQLTVKKPDNKVNKFRSNSSSSTISGLVRSESFRMTSPFDVTSIENTTKEFDSKKRFVDQIFLESSDEEGVNEEKLEKSTLMKKLETLESDIVDVEGKRKTLGRSTGYDIYPLSDALKSSNDNLSIQPRKLSLASVSSKIWSNSDLQFQNKNTPERNKEMSKQKSKKIYEERENKDIIKIAILWLQIDPSSSVGKNENINLLFVDFSFLNVKGAETETPDSLSKPKTYEEKCEFNFLKSIEITDSNKETLNSLLSSLDFDLIVFKIVSEPISDKTEDLDCEDVGVAVVTVKQFLHHYNKGPFTIPVQNMKKYKEVIGKLSVRVDATPGVFYKKN